MPCVIQQTGTFRTWFRKLRDMQAKAAIVRRLDRAATGNLGDVKSVGVGVGVGVHEMRLTQGAGYRLYFMRRQESIVLLLCGGDKSSQKQDIEIAKKLAGDIQ